MSSIVKNIMFKTKILSEIPQQEELNIVDASVTGHHLSIRAKHQGLHVAQSIWP
jgi:hypothetical protein